MTPNVETDELQSIRFLPEGFSFRFARKSVQSRCQARRSLPTSRLLRTNLLMTGLDNFRFADKSEVILPLRTEGVVIMLWPITDHSSAVRVPDNDHPAL